MTDGQQAALNISVAGHSFFLTGKSGTGKTFAVEQIFKNLNRANRKIQVTCTTGIACSNFSAFVGAITLHSFSGVKDARGSTKVLLDLVKSNEQACKRWMDTEVLVVDEVSMLSKHLFVTLEYIARVVRGNNLLFGGIQVIACGDFSQLPPVSSSDEEGSSDYVFESQIWHEVLPHSVVLSEVVRQKDLAFVKNLNDVREVHIGDEQQKFVDQHMTGKEIIPEKFGVDFVPEIFCTNDDVDFTNHLYLEELAGALKTYKSTDTGSKTLLKK